jgi:hypothetical protein
MDNYWRPGGIVFRLDFSAWLATERGSDACVPPASIEDRPLLWMAVRSQTLLSWARAYLWERKDLLLSCHEFWLFLDRLLGVNYWVGGLSTALRPGLRCWWLGVPVWMRTWTPWQEWNGMVLFVPEVQARRVFYGYLAGLHWFTNRCFYMTVRLGFIWHRSKN